MGNEQYKKSVADKTLLHVLKSLDKDVQEISNTLRSIDLDGHLIEHEFGYELLEASMYIFGHYLGSGYAKKMIGEGKSRKEGAGKMRKLASDLTKLIEKYA